MLCWGNNEREQRCVSKARGIDFAPGKIGRPSTSMSSQALLHNMLVQIMENSRFPRRIGHHAAHGKAGSNKAVSSQVRLIDDFANGRPGQADKFRFWSAAAVLRIDGQTETADRESCSAEYAGAWIGECLSSAGGAAPGRGVCCALRWSERNGGNRGNYPERFHHVGAQGAWSAEANKASSAGCTKPRLFEVRRLVARRVARPAREQTAVERGTIMNRGKIPYSKAWRASWMKVCWIARRPTARH